MAFLFRKKKEKSDCEEIGCCVSGEIIPIEKVGDSIFSTKILGDGYAVIPCDSSVYAPVDMTVKDISSDGLSVTGVTADGLNVLINFGINFSQSKKSYVKIMVKLGDEITRGEKIGEIDYNSAVKEGFDATVCVVVMNSDNLKTFRSFPSVSVSHGEKAAEYAI